MTSTALFSFIVLVLLLFFLFVFSIAFFFFFNDTATTEIYTLSLHDALPILSCTCRSCGRGAQMRRRPGPCRDRKSTRLNSSHLGISYAVFCLKKKKKIKARKRSRINTETKTIARYESNDLNIH